MPGVLSRSQYGSIVSVTQLVLGSVMVCLAVWRMLEQEQMSLAWDWPLYSGVPTICSGWVGVWLICCCRYYYPQHSHHTGTCVFPINTFSIVSRQWSQHYCRSSSMLLFHFRSLVS